MKMSRTILFLLKGDFVQIISHEKPKNKIKQTNKQLQQQQHKIKQNKKDSEKL